MEIPPIYKLDVKKKNAGTRRRFRRDKLHCNLRSADSSLAIQLQTEKIGIAVFLHARRIAGVVSLPCDCGWREGNPEHIIISVRAALATEANYMKRREPTNTKK